MNTLRRLARELVIFILTAGFIGGVVGLVVEHRELHPPVVKIDYDALACAAGATNCNPRTLWQSVRKPSNYQPCPLRTLSMLKDSKPFCVFVENASAAIKNGGYQLGVDMTGPDAQKWIVPVENQCAAEQAGYKYDDDADNAALEEYFKMQVRPGETFLPRLHCVPTVTVIPRELTLDPNPPVKLDSSRATDLNGNSVAPSPWKNAGAYLFAAGFAAAMGAFVGVALWILYRTVRFAAKG